MNRLTRKQARLQGDALALAKLREPSTGCAKTPRQALVYFVQGHHTRLIKIGRTYSLAQRLATLRATSPDPLRLLGVLRDDSGAQEHALHLRFARHRAHGEWFHADETLLSFIKSSVDTTLLDASNYS